MKHPNDLCKSWSAYWIWYPNHRHTVNFHFFARKTFYLDAKPVAAVLRVTAHTDYKLFVNGKYIGRGPTPSDPRWQSYDIYQVEEVLLPGYNVLAVVCHNYGIGVHWQYAGPGGLLAQLDIETPCATQTIVSDETWKVNAAGCWLLNSPRMSFSNGFMETFDFRVYDEHWLAPDFDDSGWVEPEVIGPHLTKPWTGLVPREIPHLEEQSIKLVPVELGRYILRGVHAVSFHEVIPSGYNYLGYAQTFVYSDSEKEVGIVVGCDDAFKAFVNNRLVLELNYSEEFSRTRLWRAGDEYEQVHYGMHDEFAKLKANLTLKHGWNKVLVVVDQGPGGWGFVLAFTDLNCSKPLDLKFGFDRKGNGRWLIAGPCESTGMNDSLDKIARDIRKAQAPKLRECDPLDYSRVTDYATLMRFEQRFGFRKIVEVPLTLRKGDVCILSLDKVWVCYPEFVFNSEGEGIVDIGYSQVLFDNRSIGYSNDGMMKYTDRVYLRDGEQCFEPLQRRTAQYIHISCREGEAIELKAVAARAVGYPVRDLAEFECSDSVINEVWRVSKHTTRVLMQYGYQDCLKREEGSINPNSFNYASRAAGMCFGDYVLARKTLRLALRTQDETGWFHGHGVSSPSSDEPTECLWWIVWLKDYYLYSGDLEFVQEVWDGLEDNLRYFAKSVNKQGLIDGRNFHVFRQGQYVYIDDSTNNGEYIGYFGGELLGYNILYYAGLRAAAYLAKEIGRFDRANFLDRKAQRVRRSINARFWNSRINRYAQWRKGNRIADKGHAAFQIAALYFGLPESREAEILMRYIVEDVGLPDENNTNYPLHTFGFFYYLLELWFVSGFDDMAVEFLRRFYGRWVELGGTAFGEGFWLPGVKGKKSLPWEYEVHGYGTSAHLHFYTNLLGIRPLAPGFQRVRIAPKPGGLTWAKGKVATPLGLIGIRWENNGTIFTLDAKAPTGCVCEFDMPAGFREYEIMLNGTRLKPQITVGCRKEIKQ